MRPQHPARGSTHLLRRLACVFASLMVLAIIRGTSAATNVEGQAIALNAALVAQKEDTSSDENEVAPQEVDKYIQVYKAMQHNRNLTVEQAAAAQGLSVPSFRSLEDRIERNDALREHVREALKPQASPSPAGKQ